MENHRIIDTYNIDQFNASIEEALDDGFVITASNAYWDSQSSTIGYYALATIFNLVNTANNVDSNLHFRDTVLEQLNDIKNILKFINGNTKK